MPLDFCPSVMILPFMRDDGAGFFSTLLKSYLISSTGTITDSPFSHELPSMEGKPSQIEASIDGHLVVYTQILTYTPVLFFGTNATRLLVGLDGKFTLVDSTTVPGSASLAYHNGFFYYFDFGDGLLYKLNPQTGTLVSSISPPGELTNPGSDPFWVPAILPYYSHPDGVVVWGGYISPPE